MHQKYELKMEYGSMSAIKSKVTRQKVLARIGHCI